MKFSLHQLAPIALACLALASHAAPISVSPGAPFTLGSGSSQIQQTFQVGTEGFKLGTGFFDGVDINSMSSIVGILNVTTAKVSGEGITESTITDEFGNISRTSVTYSRPTSSLTIDTASGIFLGTNHTGSMTWTASRTPGYVTGGQVTFSNLKIDLTAKTITADLSGVKNAVGTVPAASFSSPSTVVWTFTNVEGPTSLDPADLLSGNPAATLTAKGFSLTAQNELVSKTNLTNLQITTTALTFITRSVGALSTGINSFQTANPGPNGWGTITLTSQFGKVTGNASAFGSVIDKGQAITTGLKLANGVPLRIKHVSSSSVLSYTPLVYDASQPALTMQGLLPWLNVFGVNPQPNETGLAYNDAVADPRFGSGWSEGQTRNRIRANSNGSFITLNTTTGALAGIGGFRHDMSAGFINSALGGGSYSAQNINYVLSAKSAYGNLSGSNAGVGTGAIDTPVAPEDGSTLWTYESVTGPTTLPLPGLASATIASLPSVLQAAGFTVTSVTSSEIAFTGTYNFGSLSISDSLKNYTCVALACTAVAKDALQSPNANHLGDFRANVRFSIPLLP